MIGLKGENKKHYFGHWSWYSLSFFSVKEFTQEQMTSPHFIVNTEKYGDI